MGDKTARAGQKNAWPLEEIDGLTLVLSPLLKNISSLVHVFTTRLGGNSPSPLDSFNLGRHWESEESRRDAMNNRARLCDLLGLEANKLAVPSQKHTSNIHVLDPSREVQSGPYHFADTDAVATRHGGQPVLLHFADCVPVMLVDAVKRYICVIHAGWRGTAAGIVGKSARLMIEEFGSHPADIAAAVGPAIGPCCYQTGADVVDQLNATVQDGAQLVQFKNGSPHPDLQAYNALQLLESGVENIDVSAWCTACHPEIFYSHRQSGGKTGRQGAIACIV